MSHIRVLRGISITIGALVGLLGLATALPAGADGKFSEVKMSPKEYEARIVAGLIVILVLFAIIAAFTRTPFFKGLIGEFIVNLGTRLFLDKSTYHLVKNVTLPSGDGTTQIDTSSSPATASSWSRRRT